ncbi:hypothetical protein Salat_1171200 [Sesamum alatum]|uniref:Secreted protein n=1 Tax=Sesamum alatum TaxID=300844 RepID=A0AAE1YEN2_9LAMI|nr:hypothetical protein Salat_1171200 [Sesamum alatum]
MEWLRSLTSILLTWVQFLADAISFPFGCASTWPRDIRPGRTSKCWSHLELAHLEAWTARLEAASSPSASSWPARGGSSLRHSGGQPRAAAQGIAARAASSSGAG